MADRLETLKAKYQTVTGRMSQLGVQLLNQHIQDDKMVLRGHAKSQADANQIWEQIKLVDANYVSDLMAEFTYDAAPAAAPAPAPVAERTYTVEKGDTLSAIAKNLYGKASDYHRIFEANRDQLSDPDKIHPGQVLKIPA